MKNDALRAFHIRTGTRAFGESVDRWLSEHAAAVAHADDVYAACAHVIESSRGAPDLALVGLDSLSADERVIVDYLRRVWPATTIFAYETSGGDGYATTALAASVGHTWAEMACLLDIWHLTRGGGSIDDSLPERPDAHERAIIALRALQQSNGHSHAANGPVTNGSSRNVMTDVAPNETRATPVSSPSSGASELHLEDRTELNTGVAAAWSKPAAESAGGLGASPAAHHFSGSVSGGVAAIAPPQRVTLSFAERAALLGLTPPSPQAA